jgi:hypothetical protein
MHRLRHPNSRPRHTERSTTVRGEQPDVGPAPCPDSACPHSARFHDERVRAGRGQAPCSSWTVCASVDPAATAPALLCDPCFEERTGELAQCEDGCALPLDHDGVCGPRPAGALAPTACDECGETDRLHTVDPEEAYDHSRTKEDARNVVYSEDLADVPDCGHGGHPVRHGSGAAVTCNVCGSFCCQDHHRRHPAYRTHDLDVEQSESSLPAAQTAGDAGPSNGSPTSSATPNGGSGCSRTSARSSPGPAGPSPICRATSRRGGATDGGGRGLRMRVIATRRRFSQCA